MSNRNKPAVSAKNPSKRAKITQQRQAQQKRNQYLAIGAIVVVAIGIVALLVIPNLMKAPAVVRPNPVGTSMGDPNAPVKVEEYSDFQCPYCGRFALDQEPGIIEKYITPGKVYFTFIPFSFLGPESLTAAEAAYCAMDQGKFWDYKEELFKNQSGENMGAFSAANLTRFAKSIGLDITTWQSCLDNATYKQRVQDDLNTGKSRGVQGTPYFFVNGKGPYDSNALEGAIDAALSGK